MNIDWNKTYAAIWRQHKEYLRPVVSLDPIRLDSLVGIDRQKQELLRNTERFIQGRPCNNALLWGSRGTGKSSIIKAVLNEYKTQGLRLIEVFKHDLYYLPDIVDEIRGLPHRFIIYCDDFSFDENEGSFTALKTILDGSIELPPENVLLYATSNRRHLLPEYQSDNDGAAIVDGELHYSDAVEEKISLSDRFGLSLSFHPQSMDAYLEIVDSYFPNFHANRAALHEAAKLFAMGRATKSGRTAKHFYNYYAERDE